MKTTGEIVGFLVSLVAIGSSGCTNNPPSITAIGPYEVPEALSDYIPAGATEIELYAIEDEPLVFRVTAVDPDDDPLTFSAGPLPRDATFDPVTGEFEYVSETGREYSSGMELYFVAQDPYGGWDSVVAWFATVEIDG